MGVSSKPRSEAVAENAVLTKAVLGAAFRLGLTARALSRVIGVSEASVSRMKRGNLLLEPGTKPYELSVLLVRLFRSLDAITGGNEKLARRWMIGDNSALGGKPADKIIAVSGLVDVINYLDARRARV